MESGRAIEFGREFRGKTAFTRKEIQSKGGSNEPFRDRKLPSLQLSVKHPNGLERAFLQPVPKNHLP
jgi:hypothetical protein